MLFADAGYSVAMFDVEESQLDKAKNQISINYNMLKENGLLNGTQSIESRMALMSFTSDFEEALTDAFYVQECVPEILELKQKVFKRFDESEAIAKTGDVVLASSCSTMPISMISSEMKKRNLSIIVHPVNPVFYLKVVEIVPAEFTDAKITETARQVMQNIGRSPVVCRKEVKGFAVNRIQYAIISEAWHLVNDGVLEPEEVDTVMSEGLGPRYAFFGPWEVTLLNAPNGTMDYCQRYSKGAKAVIDTFKPPAAWEPDHPTTQRIAKQMENRVSTEHLNDLRNLRDQYLQGVCKLKSAMDKEKMIKKWKTD